MGFDRIAVIGAGAWGSALANVLTRAGRQVTLAARDRASADAIRQRRESPRLPGIRIADAVAIEEVGALTAQDAMLLAVPSQQIREAARHLVQSTAARTPVIACAKGIERGTHRFMTEVIADCLPGALPGILSGPSFAEEVAHGLPTAVTLAARDLAPAAALARAFSSGSFRLYHSDDVRGAEIGGAAKNVLAIAAGIVVGRGLGANAAAALTTRGFAELFRFGRAFGAQPETLTGLSGLGDLILSCSSRQSRNFSLGVALGEGRTPAQASEGRLAEGVFTATALVDMADQRGVDMPIATAVAAILDGQLKVDEAIENLLTRPLKAEG
jgi:glycerol-3-phosphate dehydrogenase (NAD(P)+)